VSRETGELGSKARRCALKGRGLIVEEGIPLKRKAIVRDTKRPKETLRRDVCSSRINVREEELRKRGG